MTRTTKIAIGVGAGAAVLGIAWYVLKGSGAASGAGAAPASPTKISTMLSTGGMGFLSIAPTALPINNPIQAAAHPASTAVMGGSTISKGIVSPLGLGNRVLQ